MVALLTPLRKAKHAAWLALRELGRRRKAAALARAVRDYDSAPYSYDPGRYVERIGNIEVPNSWTFPVNHLALAPLHDGDIEVRDAPRQVFALWTGDNELTSNRKRSLDALKDVASGLEFHLVTPKELPGWVLPDHPLHPAYERLSYMHRSDYLRAYLLHHHGGVYVDIKVVDGSLSLLVDIVNADDRAWVAGPYEADAWDAAPATGPLGDDQRRYHFRLVTQALMAAKPGSPFTHEVLGEVSRRMSYFHDVLPDGPVPTGWAPGYPIGWSALMGYVWNPLCLKYQEHMRFTDALTLVRDDYR